MLVRAVSWACFALMLCTCAAYAADCEIRPSNLDNFAHYRLGQRLRALPKGVKRLPNCGVYRRSHTFDCEFVDNEVSSYLASGHEIVKVERVPTASSTLPLPPPLRFGMSVEEAINALSAMDPKMVLTRSHDDGGDSLSTGECLKDSHGITYYLSLSFGKTEGLNGLAAAFDTAED